MLEQIKNLPLPTPTFNVANLVAQKSKLEAWLVDNPIVVVEPLEEPETTTE